MERKKERDCDLPFHREVGFLNMRRMQELGSQVHNQLPASQPRRLPLEAAPACLHSSPPPQSSLGGIRLAKQCALWGRQTHLLGRPKLRSLEAVSDHDRVSDAQGVSLVATSTSRCRVVGRRKHRHQAHPHRRQQPHHRHYLCRSLSLCWVSVYHV